jgi:hypothetical protein
MRKVYRNVLLGNVNKYCLIGKIKGLSIESKQTRKRFLKNPKRGSLSYRKQVLGVNIRHHLLAYAFMRGVPYSAIESKCREGNEPVAKLILTVVLAHLYPYQHSQWTEERVCKWLNGEKV